MRSILFLIFLSLLSSCTRINTEKQIGNDLLELNLQGIAQVISKADLLMQEGIPIGIFVPFKDSSISSAKASFSNRLYITEA